MGKGSERLLVPVDGTALTPSGRDVSGPETDQIPAVLLRMCDECQASVRRSNLRESGQKQLCTLCFESMVSAANATMQAMLLQISEPERRCSGCAAMVDSTVGSQWCSVLELGDTRAVICENFVPQAMRAAADNNRKATEAHGAAEMWEIVCADLESSLGQTHLSWLQNTNPTLFENRRLSVEVRDEYTRAWLVARLMPAILQSLESNGYPNASVEFIVGGSMPTADSSKPHRRMTSMQLQPAVPARSMGEELPRDRVTRGFNPAFSFEQFVVGTGNRLAHAGALAVSEGAPSYNPLFIYGGVGVGKTHLLQAIGGRCTSRGRNPVYVSSETFTNELIAAIRTSTTGEFRQRYRDIDVLLIDDIHFIIGKESTQEEFFHTFNWLYDNGKQIVLSSDRAPNEMRILDERLRSRFWWGLTADIQSPDFDTRIEILRRKSMLRGRSLPDDVLAHLAGRTSQNVRELEGMLNRLLALADVHQVEPSVLLASGLLDGGRRSREVDHNDVIQAVSAHFHVTPSSMSGKQRSRDISLPRHIAMFLMREDAKLTLPHIGDVLGGRDHSTVIYGCARVAKEMNEDSPMRRHVEAIRGLLFCG